MIIIPMAGLSSRFYKAGYKKPKFMLEAHGYTLFEHSVLSFKNYFNSEVFLFLIKDNIETEEFIKVHVEKLGIKKFHIISIPHKTRGQAETVALGLECFCNNSGLDKGSDITIFNIDTFRPNYKKPNKENLGSGYLEVFRGDGCNWSFVKPSSKNSLDVCLTTEKKPVSDLCCTGLYYFKTIRDYLEAYYDYERRPIEEWDKGELYVAPLYNYLIKKGLKITYRIIPSKSVIFCGVPDEYMAFKKDKFITE